MFMNRAEATRVPHTICHPSNSKMLMDSHKVQLSGVPAFFDQAVIALWGNQEATIFLTVCLIADKMH